MRRDYIKFDDEYEGIPCDGSESMAREDYFNAGASSVSKAMKKEKLINLLKVIKPYVECTEWDDEDDIDSVREWLKEVTELLC